MQEGTVKWFSNEMGYGFIASAHDEYFVHYKEIQGTGFKTLAEGQKVEFEIGTSARGKCAKLVTPI